MNSRHELLKFQRNDWIIYGAFALAKIAVHLLTDGPGAYGYFRDELYYLDCVHHLGLGYVDQPPLSIFILALTRALLGSSMLAIRLPVILIGAASIVMTGLVAREMGGGRFAQAIACLSVLTAPVFLAMGSFFSMNAFDQFFWVLSAFLIARLIRTGHARLWLGFGLVAGLGLENKLSMAVLGAALAGAMLLTPLRAHYRKWQFWAGGLIAAALFVPHVIWQIKYGFPTLEFMRGAGLYKNMPTTPWKFTSGQLLLVGPLAAPIWIAGLLFSLSAKRARPFRVFGLIYLIVLVVFYVSNGKVYYVSPAYPMLLALGAVWIEKAVSSRTWAKAAMIAALAVQGFFLAPLAIPVLEPASFLRYQDAIGIRAPQQERAHGGPLPQHLGDRLGWEEFVAMVADAYGKIDPADKARCSIFTGNYGEAGAINLFGPRYGLPRAVSGYMSYYLWGPGDATGEVMLVYEGRREDLEKIFEQVTEVARFRHPYVMDRQNDVPLFLCRNLKVPLREAWTQVKAFH